MFCYAAVAYGLTSSDIVGTQPEGYGQKPNACELHVEFKYRLPDEPDATKWTLADLVTNPTEIDNFLKRVIEVQIEKQASYPIYLHAFSSYEGGVAANEEIAVRRSGAMQRLVNERLQALKQQYPADVVSSIGGLSGGTVKWKTDTFWKLSDTEKDSIDTYYRTNPTLQEKSAVFEANQALRENRRAILTFNARDFSLVPVSAGFFDTGGCPAPKPPAPAQVCGNSQVEGTEACDPPGSECGTNLICDETCQCISGPPIAPTPTPPTPTPTPTPTPQPTPPGMVCEKDNKKASNEECDPTATPTGCPADRRCSEQCSCYVEGVGATGKSYWWALLLLLLLVPMIYKRKRVREEIQAKHELRLESIKSWGDVLKFLMVVKTRKEKVKEDIEELVVLIKKDIPKLKEGLKKAPRDVAYYLDKDSPETKNLDEEGRLAADVLQKYYQLLIDLKELYADEMTIEKVLIVGRTLRLSNAVEEQRLVILLEQTKVEITYIRRQLDVIIKEIEHRTVEGGIILSGVVSLIGGTVRDWRKDKGVMARLRHWHDQTYLRSDKHFGAGKKGIARALPGTRTLEKDYGYTKPSGEEYPLGQDLAGKDKVKSVKMVTEMLEKLVVDVETNSAAYVELTTRVKRQNDLIIEIIELISLSENPLIVKIDFPKQIKIKSSKTNELLKGKRDFIANIQGGLEPYSFVWHWGTFKGPETTLEEQMGINTPIVKKGAKEILTLTDKKGTDTKAVLEGGFKALKEKFVEESRDPFLSGFSVDGKGERYLLHVTVKDKNGKIAHDQVAVDLELRNVITGKVIDAATGKAVEGAIVWLEHLSKPAENVHVITPYSENGMTRYERTSLKNGEFKLEGTFKQSITVHAEKDGIKGKHTDLEGNPMMPFDMPSNGIMENVKVPLKITIPEPTEKEYVIEGKVVDFENPDVMIEGARVWATHLPVLHTKNRTECMDAKGELIQAVTDKKGRFELKGVFKFNIIVHAEKGKEKGTNVEGGYPDKEFDCPCEEMGKVIVPIKEPSKETVIKGRVINAYTRDGIKDARVWLTFNSEAGFFQVKDKNGQPVTTQSGENGEFSFTTSEIPDLLIRVGAEKDGVSARSTDSNASPGKLIQCPPGYDKVVIPLEIKENEKGVIQGRVIDANTKKGIKGASVWLSFKGTDGLFRQFYSRDPGIEGETETTSEDDGSFRFEGKFMPNLRVGAKKDEVTGYHTDGGGSPKELLRCPPGQDKVIVPLKLEKEMPGAVVVPTDNPKPHPPYYGTHGKPVVVYPGHIMDMHGAERRGADEQYINAELDFFLIKEIGERTMGWMFTIEHVKEGETTKKLQQMSPEQRREALMKPKKWNLRAIIKGVKAKNPYTYDDGYKYHKFRPPADVVDTRTNHVGFDPYIDVPVDAEPGLYRIVLRIIDWPRLKGLAGMFTRMDVTQFEELDYNYVELMIPKKVPPSAKSVIKGKVVDHDHPETPIKGATVWIQLSDTPDFKEKQDYTENGELVKYITKADGMFELKGLFGQKFVQVYATTENGGEGYHKTPPEPFKCPPDRDDVIVPMVFPAAEPGFKIPEPISKDIKDNLDKIMLIAQGKIGAQKLPPEVRGLGNHARKVIEQMMKEIEEHNSEVAKKGASRYKHNPKPSSPRGLNNFKEGRFFGFLQDVGGMQKKMSIVNIEKFIFGSLDPMLIDMSGKGWKFCTGGMKVGWMTKEVLAGDVNVAAEIVKLIDEKKELFEEYSKKLKDVESQIDRKIHEARNNGDKQLLTLYEKMKTCFTNIRQYIESHKMIETLDLLKMYIMDESIDKLTKYIESWNPKGKDNMQRSPSYGPESWEYRLTGMKKDVRTEYPAQDFGLVQAVDEVVAVLKKHINDLRIELNSTIPVVEGNYAELKKDIQQFQELHRSRAQARAGIRAA